jgi:hypothetical protein
VGGALTSAPAPSLASGPLVLADISGYTSFLQTVAHAHRDDAFAGGAVPDAYSVISSLLDGIVERLVPPFMLSKLEGDAVFAYSDGSTSVPRGQEALDCLNACYEDFRRRLDKARGASTCWCDACLQLNLLDLKFVLHAGAFVIQTSPDSGNSSGRRSLSLIACSSPERGSSSATTDTHSSPTPQRMRSTSRTKAPSSCWRLTTTPQ